ncbi:AP2/ERF domain-containing transcription factor [Forsythia ovata]|uniref:AP2/ERF domain-containing transcription factor n=1 Tax=Forsythia ovata TaxID=205694 RepID=A0ABD1UVI6_9LAMI
MLFLALLMLKLRIPKTWLVKLNLAYMANEHGRWQARIGRVAGNKDLYLGTFSTQEEAAEAYNIAAIKFCGVNAVTNFEISRYDVKSILESSTLPIGGAVKRLKDAENAEMALDIQRKANNGNHNSHLTDGLYTIMAGLIPYHFILNGNFYGIYEISPKAIYIAYFIIVYFS